MLEATASTGDDQIERALDELMRATDAFVVSWSTAVRRFAAEPTALTRFRELHEAGLAPIARSDPKPVAEFIPHASPHPLWDAQIDG